MKVDYAKLQYGARAWRLKRHHMTYSQYLQSDLWRTIRQKLRAHPEFQTCYCCGFDQFIELHHVSYVNMFEPKLHNHRTKIRALCSFCHEKVHDMAKKDNLGLRQASRRLRKERLTVIKTT